MNSIADIRAYEILDSRGVPTLSVHVHLANAVMGEASVPSGSSTGEREAVELRDGDAKRYAGRGVLKSVIHVRDVIAPRLRGIDVMDQAKIDHLLCELDGTPNKSHLGSNTVLGVSLAVARAGAIASGHPLYIYLACLAGRTDPPDEQVPYVLPAPMIAVINGGKHANNTLDLQEIMLSPLGAPRFAEAVRWGAEIFQALKALLNDRHLSTAVGDAGGLSWSSKPSNRRVTIPAAT
jgi:enolase